MLPKNTESCILAKFLAKGVLIDDVLFWPILICSIKDGGCYPSSIFLLAQSPLEYF
jgi:hypothetical protein